jgi:hypothetical protein
MRYYLKTSLYSYLLTLCALAVVGFVIVGFYEKIITLPFIPEFLKNIPIVSPLLSKLVQVLQVHFTLVVTLVSVPVSQLVAIIWVSLFYPIPRPAQMDYNTDGIEYPTPKRQA